MKNLLCILLTAFTVQAFSQSETTSLRKGNSKYKEGNYQQAEVEYRKALEKDPDSYKAEYNMGNALYKQKQYDAAIGRYAELAEKETDKNKKSQYYYNLGNAYFENQKYKESIEAYKMALRNNPSDADAKHNLQFALRMLQEQQQQQNQQGGDNKEKNEQDNNQQNQDNKQDQQDNQNSQDQQDNQGNQEQQNQQENAQPQPVKGQITPEDAERILQALENQEKEVMKRVQEKKEQVRKVPVDKNW